MNSKLMKEITDSLAAEPISLLLQSDLRASSYSTEILREDCNSVKVLVMLDNGDKRLIGFTIPFRKIFNHAGITTEGEIKSMKTFGSDVDFIVKGGKISLCSASDATTSAEGSKKRKIQEN